MEGRKRPDDLRRGAPHSDMMMYLRRLQSLHPAIIRPLSSILGTFQGGMQGRTVALLLSTLAPPKLAQPAPAGSPEIKVQSSFRRRMQD